MTKEMLVKLVSEVVDAESDEEFDRKLNLLQKNVPHPRVINLIYYPQKEVPHMLKDREELTVEEIVDIALSYKPIQL